MNVKNTCKRNVKYTSINKKCVILISIKSRSNIYIYAHHTAKKKTKNILLTKHFFFFFVVR